MQSVGLLQSVIERSGILTVALTFNADFTRLIGAPRAVAVRFPYGAPRAVAVRFPYGAPFGDPRNRWLQTRVLREALSLLETATEPNTIIPSAYRWRQTRDRAAW